MSQWTTSRGRMVVFMLLVSTVMAVICSLGWETKASITESHTPGAVGALMANNSQRAITLAVAHGRYVTADGKPVTKCTAYVTPDASGMGVSGLGIGLWSDDPGVSVAVSKIIPEKVYPVVDGKRGPAERFRVDVTCGKIVPSLFGADARDQWQEKGRWVKDWSWGKMMGYSYAIGRHWSIRRVTVMARVSDPVDAKGHVDKNWRAVKSQNVLYVTFSWL